MSHTKALTLTVLAIAILIGAIVGSIMVDVGGVPILAWVICGVGLCVAAFAVLGFIAVLGAWVYDGLRGVDGD